MIPIVDSKTQITKYFFKYSKKKLKLNDISLNCTPKETDYVMRLLPFTRYLTYSQAYFEEKLFSLHYCIVFH